ncbi:MAG TPA: chorismate mutase [Micropepsaceae bacterium]|nr:chorismate mutase [Micropepsaceae bacterium]
MQNEPGTLEDLRGEIDRIDDALHDLLIRRANVSLAIAKVKQPAEGAPATPVPALRPAREAMILRRLLARHKGDLPPQVLVRIWREIMAASLRVQSKFHLHVYSGDNPSGFVDLAHAHFGSLTPLRTHTRPSMVVHACAEEPNSLGIVPVPEIEEPGAAWWAQLAPAGEKGPRVVAKLPFAQEGEDGPTAYAIGTVEQEPSGDDTTLLLLEIAPGISRASLQSYLKTAGLKAKLKAAGRLLEKKVPDEILLEVKGFVGKDDPRLVALADAAGEVIARVVPIGGYANPVVLPPVVP